ncbi:uncharacterized protein LOC131928000 [Physella acuta]|uniref:uncharacterized protein LOC131928000 n=1 Tax=Physella acuta TaxID=109671 RepID=UPI0027DB39C3|nr:uncharacterized protein LOC131928000 [Physella acuta]
MGNYCNTHCDKPCVMGHGMCHGFADDTQNYCNCEHEWEGEFCENVKPDPRALAVKAQEQEHHARVMAGVLTACVAFVLLLAIVVPVVLWRLRVIFVIKLVYYFKEYEDSDGKQYDAYVSMTPTASAEKFVYNELRPVLEDRGFKLYIQARDSPSNEALSDIILSALEKSRRTIMVVTSDYLSNEWNRFEYLIAQHETLKLKQRIISIILEDIDKEQVKLDKSLKYILDSVKCLNHPRLKQQTDAQRPELGEPSAKSDKEIWHTEMSEKSFKSSISQEKVEYEKREKKFWQRLELSMPKKKKQNKKKANKKTVENPKVKSTCIEKFGAKRNLPTKEDAKVVTIGFKMNNLNESSGMPCSNLENKFLNILNGEPCVTDPSSSRPQSTEMESTSGPQSTEMESTSGPQSTEMESTSGPQSTEMASGYYNTSHSIDFLLMEFGEIFF